MVRSDVWRQVAKALRHTPPERVLAGLARSRDPDAQFLLHAVADRASVAQLRAALTALARLCSHQRASIAAAVRPPRHLAAAYAVLALHPEADDDDVDDDLYRYLDAVIADGSARSLARLAPIVRHRLAGPNDELETFCDQLADYGRTPGMRRLAARMRAARLARLRKSPGGRLNALAGLDGDVPARFSLWLDAVDDTAHLELLINAPNGEWLDVRLIRGASEFLQFGAKVSGRLRRPRLTRLADLPGWLASVGVAWAWDAARWNTPLRGRAFAKLRAWLAGAPVGPGRSNAG